jgi:hypothetical protein
MRRFLTLAAPALSAALALPAFAQTANPASAPLPDAITHASKLFLGNAGDQENADCLRAYNDFYDGIAALKRFQQVTDPNQADLILELHYEIDLGQSVASNDSRQSVRRFRVVLIDPHSHATLWSLTERTNYAVFKSNRNKNLDETVANLVSDFSLLTQSLPPSNSSHNPHLP